MEVDEITFFRHWKQEHPTADFAAISAHCRRAEELAEDKHKATFLRKWAEIAEEESELMADSCSHPEIWFSSGDYYVRCPACLAQWGRLSRDGRPEYRTLEDGTKIGCAPEEANGGFVNDGKSRHI